jgi:exonuclease SbcD
MSYANARTKTGIEGAFVRVRWTVPEENRHDVDREAIAKLFGTAAEVKLEGRVIPVARTRAAGIAQEASITGKVKAWALVTGTDAAPLLACLEALQSTSAEEVASAILFGTDRIARAVRQADEGAGEDPEHGEGDGAVQGEETRGETAGLF